MVDWSKGWHAPWNWLGMMSWRRKVPLAEIDSVDGSKTSSQNHWNRWVGIALLLVGRVAGIAPNAMLSQRVAEIVNGSTPRNPTSDMDLIRRKFDIFFSRIDSLASNAWFRDLERHPKFSASITRLQAFLTGSIPPIDGCHSDLRLALPDMDRALKTLRAVVREMSAAVLMDSTTKDDGRRRNVSTTSLRPARITGFLLIALPCPTAPFCFLNRTSERRRRGSFRPVPMAAITGASLNGEIVTDTKARVLPRSAKPRLTSSAMPTTTCWANGSTMGSSRRITATPVKPGCALH